MGHGNNVGTNIVKSAEILLPAEVLFGAIDRAARIPRLLVGCFVVRIRVRVVRLLLILALLALGLLAPGGCRKLQKAPSLPVRNRVVREQLVLYTDFKLPRQHLLLDELTSLRADVSKKLATPISEEPIHVYLFQTQDQFQDFMHGEYPKFPTRRAFFIETDTRLNVYAYWGDRVAEDLRHEVSHGYMHSVVPHLPLWLDEGLAEFFEVARGDRGLHRPHIENLVGRYNAGIWKPDLKRLARLRYVAEMTQVDYAESWAWAHLLLETTGPRRRLLHDYLRELREQGSAGPLSARLLQAEPSIERWLVDYLHDLHRRK